ncbi:MAG: TolC family outer membrane protein [Pseudodonghicola sp.]
MALRNTTLRIAYFTSAFLFSFPAFSQSLHEALAQAYQNNASLNAARAGVRVTNESVPLAKSTWRPTIVGQGQINHQTQSGTEIFTGSFGVSIQQSLFDGFQTLSNVRAAEAQVRAANENLRNTEQNILFNAASAYMDVVRDRQIAVLQERNLEALNEELRAARSRLEVGEGTQTDVSQAQASRAAAVAQLSAARAQAQASEALYRQVVGVAPGKVSSRNAAASKLPANIDTALNQAISAHPAIIATGHLIDAASFSVKSAEGALLPSVNVTAGVSSTYTDTSSGLPGVGMSTRDGTSNSASIGLNLTIPIYQGGRVSAQVRQKKEELGQARIELDVARDQVRQAVMAAFAHYMAAVQAGAANREMVAAARLALQGVTEERNVGQRTTLDVLNAQADVINAQINLVSAERDAVVASYAILSAIGALTARKLGLAGAIHDPAEHYDAVKDRWVGTRTPDGR